MKKHKYNFFYPVLPPNYRFVKKGEIILMEDLFWRSNMPLGQLLDAYDLGKRVNTPNEYTEPTCNHAHDFYMGWITKRN
jgi:hypothetical protein